MIPVKLQLKRQLLKEFLIYSFIYKPLDSLYFFFIYLEKLREVQYRSMMEHV